MGGQPTPREQEAGVPDPSIPLRGPMVWKIPSRRRADTPFLNNTGGRDEAAESLPSIQVQMFLLTIITIMILTLLLWGEKGPHTNVIPAG